MPLRLAMTSEQAGCSKSPQSGELPPAFCLPAFWLAQERALPLALFCSWYYCLLTLR